MRVSFGNSGDISWKISELNFFKKVYCKNFCKKDLRGQTNVIRLSLIDAFSVAKVFVGVAHKT